MIKSLVNNIIAKYNTTNPEIIAENEGIHIYYRNDFKELLGVYTIINDIDCIFINSNLDENLIKQVIAHELGHYFLHRNFAKNNILHDYGFYDISGKVEYEANIFAAELLIPDNILEEYIHSNYTIDEIASDIYTLPQLLYIKLNELKKTGKNISIPYIPYGNFLSKIRAT